MAPTGRRRIADDDVLTGFDRTGDQRGELRGFFTTSIVASLYVWDAAFQFGAYRTVFFGGLQHLLVLAMVILVGSMVVHRRIRVHPWLLGLFAPPILLYLFRLSTPVKRPGGAVRVADNYLVIVTVVALPVILWVIARLLAPEYFGLPSRRLKIAVVAITAGVGVIGYLTGAYNYRVLTCEDFVVSGAQPPANCLHSGHP